MDGQTDIMKLIVAFRNFLNALKNSTLPQSLSCNVQTKNAGMMFCPIGTIKLSFPKWIVE
jgi:hypothetical protein